MHKTALFILIPYIQSVLSFFLQSSWFFIQAIPLPYNLFLNMGQKHMPNLYYVDICGFTGDCVCVRVVLKLIEEVMICLMYFFSTEPPWL